MQQKCGTNLGRLSSEAPDHGARVVGAWADVAGHTFYYVIEAPNAHVISTMVTDLELFHWNTLELRPVIDMT